MRPITFSIALAGCLATSAAGDDIRNQVADRISVAEAEVRALVEDTTPVVRLPSDLILELARIEEVLFEADVKKDRMIDRLKEFEAGQAREKNEVENQSAVALRLAEAVLEERRALVAQSEQSVHRVKRLVEQGYSPTSELSEVEATLLSRQLQVQMAKAELEEAKRAARKAAVQREAATDKLRNDVRDVDMLMAAYRERSQQLKTILPACQEYGQLVEVTLPSLQRRLAELELPEEESASVQGASPDALPPEEPDATRP